MKIAKSYSLAMKSIQGYKFLEIASKKKFIKESFSCTIYDDLSLTELIKNIRVIRKKFPDIEIDHINKNNKSYNHHGNFRGNR